jgi:hypothetical protein
MRPLIHVACFDTFSRDFKQLPSGEAEGLPVICPSNGSARSRLTPELKSFAVKTALEVRSMAWQQYLS